jgi:hypothetical protein
LEYGYTAKTDGLLTTTSGNPRAVASRSIVQQGVGEE